MIESTSQRKLDRAREQRDAEAAVEPEAPAAVTAEPEQPQPQTHALADPTTQPTFFDQSAECDTKTTTGSTYRDHFEIK